MRGRKAKEVRRLVAKFSHSKNDANYNQVPGSLSRIRELEKTSAKLMEKVVKRLVKHTPWNKRHIIISQLEFDSQGFLK